MIQCFDDFDMLLVLLYNIVLINHQWHGRINYRISTVNITITFAIQQSTQYKQRNFLG